VRRYSDRLRRSWQRFDLKAEYELDVQRLLLIDVPQHQRLNRVGLDHLALQANV
jgi:hypothetical protein